MKKNILQLICLLLSLVLLTGVLFSCSEQPTQEPDTTDASEENDNNDKKSKSPEKQLSNKELAFQLFEKANQVMEKVDSYTGTAISSLDYTAYDTRMVVSSSATGTYSGHNSDQFRYRLETEGVATMYYGTTKLSEMKQTIRNGFENGKMFYFSKHSEDGGTPQTTKLYSTISAADYQAFQKQIAEDMDISAKTCNKASCEQNADKSWTAVYSGFNQTMIRTMGIGEMAQLIGSNVQCDDITITITFTEDYYPTMMSADFSFSLVDPENTDVSLPTLSVTANYKDINATQAPAAENMSGYKKVDDLRVPDLLDKALNDYLDSPSGNFEVFTNTLITIGTNNTQENATRNVSFTNENGKLSYKIKNTDKDGIDTYTYEDGVLLFSKTGDQGSTDYTDQAARVDLMNSLHPISVTNENIKDIKVISQNGNSTAYSIYFKESEIVDEILESGGTLISGNYTLTVTLTDGKVTAYNYSLVAKISYSGQTMNVDAVISVVSHTAN